MLSLMNLGKCISLYNHHPNQDIEHFHYSKKFRYTLLQSTSSTYCLR